MLSPEDSWPAHQKPYWRDALIYARANGWWLKRLEGHGWGIVSCSPSAGEDVCRVLIFSTGEASENVARDLHKRVDRCPHRDRSVPPTGAEARLAKAKWHLEQADVLVTAAERCAQADDKAHLAGELLEAASQSLEESEALLEAASEAEAEAAQAERDAEAGLAAGGIPTTSLDIAGLASEAHSEVQQAQRQLGRINRSRPEKRRLQAIADVLRGRISALR